MMERNKIFQGDCLAILKTLPSNSIDCCITSPPYYRMRNYGVAGQIGLEESPTEYVKKLVCVFTQVKRVLKPTGTLWLNIGDTYAGSSFGAANYPASNHKWSQVSNKGTLTAGLGNRLGRGKNKLKIKEKDLMGIPWLLAFALRKSGWYLRQEIIWAKPNPMPESVSDRCTRAHEQIFLLTKSAHYFFDAEAIKTDSLDPIDDRGSRGNQKRKPTALISGIRNSGVYAKANKRSVWTVNPQPFSEAHFATFPEKLIEPCILAGTSAYGCCATCGKPYERKIKRSGGSTGQGTWHPSCDCQADVVKPLVLDPFAGAGTTLLVAKKKGRDYIGIELNEQYIAMANRRIANELGLFVNM